MIHKGHKIELPTTFGIFLVTAYRMEYKDQPNSRFMLVLETKKQPAIPTVRIHSSCIFSEVFGSLRCDCANQLNQSLQIIQQQGGMVLYLDQEGRGHGILNKIHEYKLQLEQGLDTVEASEHLSLDVDNRKYDAAIQILKDRKILKIKLITNNPHKIKTVEGAGIEIIERVKLDIQPNKYNENYMKTKKSKLGHL